MHKAVEGIYGFLETRERAGGSTPHVQTCMQHAHVLHDSTRLAVPVELTVYTQRAPPSVRRPRGAARLTRAARPLPAEPEASEELDPLSRAGGALCVVFCVPSVCVSVCGSR